MTDVNNKTFGLSKDNKRKAMILCLAMTALGLFVAYMDGDPVGILFFLPIPGIILAITFRTQLIISNEYIRTTDGLFTFHSSWDNIEKVMAANGLLAKHPVLSYRKWAAPIAWRSGWLNPRFTKTINLTQFDKDWLNSKIGYEIAKHIPELVDPYRFKSMQ